MQLKQSLLTLPIAIGTIGAVIIGMASCQPGASNSQATGRKLLDPANMDTTVRPGDNFFEYANGAWLKKNPIPKSKPFLRVHLLHLKKCAIFQTEWVFMNHYLEYLDVGSVILF